MEGQISSETAQAPTNSKKNTMRPDKKITMLTSPIGKLLWKFGIPSLVGMLANALHNTIDAYFLGTVSLEAVAAVGLVFPVLMIGSAIGLAFGSGAASIISRDLGGDNRGGASQTLSTTLVVSVFVGTVMAILIGLFARPILRTLGSDASLSEIARRYLLIVLPGGVIGIGSMVLNNATRAEGAPLYGMIVIITGAILNSLLDAILVGVLSFGVTGAAVATLVAQVLTFGALLSRYLLRRSTVQIGARQVLGTEHRIRLVIATGFPAFIFQILTIASLATLNALAGASGASHVAGVTVAYRVITLAVFVQFGFAKGIQPVIGFNWGAGQFTRAQSAALATIGILAGFGLVFTLSIQAFGTEIAGMFVQGDAAEFAIRIMTYQSFFLPLGALSVVLLIYYLAIGKTKETAILALVRQGLLLIPLAVLMNALGGTSGLSLAPGTADAIVSVLGILMLVRSGIVQTFKPALLPNPRTRNPVRN